MSKNKPKPKKPEKNKKVDDGEIQLVIDTNPIPYLEQENVLVIDPRFSSQFRCLRRNQFGSCIIKNSSVDNLGGCALSFVLDSLKEKGTMTIYLNTNLNILIDYDFNQLKAAAEYAGFGDIERGEEEIVDENDNRIVVPVLVGKKITQDFEEEEVKKPVPKEQKGVKKGKK